VKPCPRCGEENLDRARFCQACGRPLDATADDDRDVKKTVTILFADVVDSTGLAVRLGPDRFRRVMASYFDVAKSTVERHGGTIEKFIGDAVMAVFGIPELHEDDALRALRAASEFTRALERINAELASTGFAPIRVRCGIDTGEVLAGGIAEGESLVSGDTVHVAARLQQIAAPGEVLFGRATHRLVSGSIRAHSLEALSLKGFEDAIHAYRLVEVLPEHLHDSLPIDAPLVGRDHEMGLLYEAFERVCDRRRCELFTVLGNVGVGKTRLVLEFMRAVEGDATLLHGRCPSYGESSTFYPLTEIVKQSLNVTDDEAKSTVRRKLDAAVSRRAAKAIAQLIGLEDLQGSARDNFWAAAELLARISRSRPLVVVVDDIQWGEATFLELIKQTIERVASAPILVVCIARTELLELNRGWLKEQDNAASVMLAPLGDQECTRLVEYVLGAGRASDGARNLIVRSAQGNPLFLQEMMAMLIDEGLLVDEEGRYVLNIGPDVLKVPPTIQALLAARLDRLDKEEGKLIETASVVGELFYESEMAALLDVVDGSLGEGIVALIDKELIRQERSRFSDDRAYRFHHTLIREVAYERLPLEERARIHERFARHLETAARGWSRSYQELVGYHYERAAGHRLELGYTDEHSRELVRNATDQLAAAGRKAFAGRDMPAAVNLLSRALGLMAEDESKRLELLPLFADALAEAGEHDAAYDIATEAIESARVSGARGVESYALTVLLKLPRRPGFKISLGYGIGNQGMERGFRLRN
jgi:class 3 adenylate cyclase